MQFQPLLTLQMRTKCHIFGIASQLSAQEMGCSTVLQGKTFLAAEWFHILHLVYKVDGRSFWKSLSATHGSHPAISVRVDYDSALKILDSGYPPSKWNGILCYNKSHSLLFKYVITLIGCVRKVGLPSDSTQEPFYCPNHAIYVKVNSQIACNLPDLG